MGDDLEQIFNELEAKIVELEDVDDEWMFSREELLESAAILIKAIVKKDNNG